ncbi:MAG: anhydro-N-acetylmuramic acid kinase [Flavobacteriales bacterium]
MRSYKVIGLMSGTSCDGLDIAYCEFKFDTKWSFQIIKTKMVEYSSFWQDKLRNAHLISKLELENLDVQLGQFFGKETKKFIEKNKIEELDFVASHGHTVFHQPDKGFTLQIGCGKEIKKQVETTVINDFRSADVAAGGQGAPLVPIGDELLFSEYDYCVNIGGIANYSYQENGIRKAQDICFANMILNPLALQLGQPFDRDGNIAKTGVVNPELLRKLMKLDFNNKSLGNEQYQEVILPIIESSNSITETLIATVTDYTARKIAEVLQPNSEVLITGGGAYNSFMMSKIEKYSKAKIIFASQQLIEFKEALIFAFLGVLKMENIPNCLASVTGASEDVVGGVVV